MTGKPPAVPPAHRRFAMHRSAVWIGIAGLLGTSILLPLNATARQNGQSPPALSDADFWEFFTTRSEAGGTFVSENFVSNETSFQDVIPSLQGSLTPDGVYLGVGPEQNFTYIANLKPRLAVIFDIRRQNAMQHLMYKALFELSPTRADFIAKLFSRPFRVVDSANVTVMFDSVSAAAPSDSAWEANREAIVAQLTRQHHFDLSSEDLASIMYVYRVFYEAGPAVNYGYRPDIRMTRSSYATFGMLQSATNAAGERMAFLASDSGYAVVRDLQQRNLVIPVVADFAGPSAIRSVGEYIWERGMSVTAFYLSNVEQYLFREGGAADRFYGNVSSLPTDSTSMFIRSVPRSGASLMNSAMGSVVLRQGSPGGRLAYSISVSDSAGVRVYSMVQDSGGTPILRTWTDSAGRATPARIAFVTTPHRDSVALQPDTSALRRADSVAAATLRGLIAARDSVLRIRAAQPYAFTRPYLAAGTLTSGIVPIHQTLEAHFGGRLTTYQSVVAMTKTTGWQ